MSLAQHIGDCIADNFVIALEDAPIDVSSSDLYESYSSALESQLVAEVLA